MMESLSPLNYDTKNNISVSVIKISFIYLIIPIDFTNDQNAMLWVTLGYIYKLNIKIHVKDNTRNVLILAIVQDTFAKFVG